MINLVEHPILDSAFEEPTRYHHFEMSNSIRLQHSGGVTRDGGATRTAHYADGADDLMSKPACSALRFRRHPLSPQWR